MQAYIAEIFSSLQGEGQHTGEPTTFVRFSGCSSSCKWCDTKAAHETSQFVRIETPPGKRQFINYENPFTIEKLNEHLAFFSDPTISVTGGEPLEQAAFLEKWLPTLKPAKKILLETNGVLPKALEKTARFVDTISMDIKLPSSTGGRDFWREHTEFLSKALASGKETYIKIVVTEETVGKEIQEAIKLVTSINKYVPVILQPASATENFQKNISNEQLQSFERLCKLWLPNVTIMRQTHKELGIL
ncbi:MAG: hypothetical protein A3I09_05065 [Deltaproteobacteria bacterium RIFCSPLOWO2_02_FULL_47_10]|nr:MAG: hypothetical protein A3I09_05065 [Deltaproteobacteria bacterium RIFCSPLOWO2_02_FULL_47_10]